MARPFKEGLDYYNLDSNRYQDRKIKKLKHTFSTAGLAVYDFLLCEIYRDKGCFLVWGEDTAIDVASYFGLKVTLVNEIVNYCCVVDLFSNDVLTSEKVLTSKSIQGRYMQICILSKRKKIIIPESIRLIPDETLINSGGKAIDSGRSTQSKENESKENESKEPLYKDEGEITETPSLVLRRLFPRLLEDKAKNGGLGPDQIEVEMMNFDNHHLKQGTAFSDAKHILNSWGKWCENYFSKKQENFKNGKQQETVTSAKKPTDKTASDWL